MQFFADCNYTYVHFSTHCQCNSPHCIMLHTTLGHISASCLCTLIIVYWPPLQQCTSALASTLLKWPPLFPHICPWTTTAIVHFSNDQHWTCSFLHWPPFHSHTLLSLPPLHLHTCPLIVDNVMVNYVQQISIQHMLCYKLHISNCSVLYTVLYIYIFRKCGILASYIFS